MDKFFGVVGSVCIASLVMAVCAATMALMVHVAGMVYDKWRHDIIFRRDQELGQILKSGSHWLSYDPKLQELLLFLSENIQGGYSMYAGHWHDQWERFRKAKP
jgi:hypothetical protein